MSKIVDAETSARQRPPLDLGDPVFAAILAWLIPGAGHFYQRRRTKALLFFVCIMGTFGYGLWLGGGRVVYAAWGPTSDEKRLPYLCQVGTGLVTMPALVQAVRFKNPEYVKDLRSRAMTDKRTFWDWFMAPPLEPERKNNGDHEVVGEDELDRLNYDYNRRFELGTVYTMIAGLLNLLVIFDAGAGPALGVAPKPKPPEPDKSGKPAPAV